MITRLYRVEVLLTCYVAADSPEEASKFPSIIVRDVEDFHMPQPAETRSVIRVKDLEEVPEEIRGMIPSGLSMYDDCECYELEQEELTRDGIHGPNCGYGLTVRELIEAQDRDRGIDGVTLPLLGESP